MFTDDIRNKLIFGLLGLAVAMGAIVYHQLTVGALRVETARLTGEAERLTDERASLEANLENAAASLRRQSEAVTKMEEEAKARSAAAAAALAAAQRQAAAYQQTAQELSKRPMPKPGDACGSLESLLNDVITERKK